MKHFPWYIPAPPATYNYFVASFGFTDGGKASASKWLPSSLPREEPTSFPLPIRSTQPPQPLWGQGVKGLSTGACPETAPLPGPCRKLLHCSDLPVLCSASVCPYEEGYLPFPQSSSRPTEEKQHYKSNTRARRHSVPAGRLLHSVALECHCRNYCG